MGAILLVAGLAVAATGCHGVDALQFDTGVPVDALRTGVSPVNEACDVESTHVALQKVSDELRDGIDDLDAWTDFIGLPVTGMIMTDDGDKSVHLSGFRPNDDRDAESFYASTSKQLHKAVIFLFDVESNGLLLQAVDNAAHRPVGDGMFLTAHNAYPDDSQYDDMLRLIVHSDPNKAVIWQFVPVCGKTYLMVKENRAATATGTGGWFVAVPPDSDRDKHSNYLAITSDVAKAMPVAVVPAVPGNLP